METKVRGRFYAALVSERFNSHLVLLITEILTTSLRNGIFFRLAMISGPESESFTCVSNYSAILTAVIKRFLIIHSSYR